MTDDIILSSLYPYIPSKWKRLPPFFYAICLIIFGKEALRKILETKIILAPLLKREDRIPYLTPEEVIKE